MSLANSFRKSEGLQNRCIMAIAIFVLFQSAIVISILGASDVFFLLQTAITAERLSLLTSSLTPTSIAIIQGHYLLDSVHPIVYTVLLMQLIAAALIKRGWSETYNFLIYLCCLPGLLDFMENSLHAPYIYDVAGHVNAIWAGSLFATMKWIGLAVLSGLGLIIAFGGQRKSL